MSTGILPLIDSETIMTNTVETLSVPALNLGNLTKRLDKLARKANKYGNSPIGYSIGETTMKETTIYIDNNPKKIETEFVDITVWGDAPKYGDHKFLARVELNDGENIVSNLGGKPLNERFRFMVSECDHCGHNRVRNDVYVFENNNGEQIAVGKTCLRDFTGCDNPLEIVNRAKFIQDIKTACDEELNSFGGGYGNSYFTVNEVLQYASANIRVNGWVSKSMAMNSYDETIMTTSDYVMMDLFPNAKRKPIETTIEDQQMANTVMEYFRNMEYNKDNGDYINNLRVIINSDTVKIKHIGLLVSAVNVILKEKQKKAESQTSVSNYVGSIKERMRGIELTFVREISLGFGMYGEQYLYTFQDNSGNVFVWITTHREFIIGETIVMDFTIKAHKEYKDIKQNIITRATIK